MANRKKQIKLTQDGIRRMISEAIKSYSFNGEGFNDEPDDKFDILGNPKYPGGIFSTDSEEGEAFKERAKKYDKPEDNELWNQREMKLWADTHDSLLDTDRKLDKMARDEFGDEEEEGQLYDKPFGDLDDTENQWADEPGYEEEDEDDNIAGLNEGKITLTEEGLRNFISYSVARLLKEAYTFQGKEIILPNGETDGYEESDYGSSSIEIPIAEWMENEYKGSAIHLIEYVDKENDGKFTEIISSEKSPVDAFLNCLEDLPEDAFTLEVSFTYEEGMKSHDYDQPDDQNSLTIDNKRLKNTDALNMIQDPQAREFVSAVVKEWPEWVDEDYIMENCIESSLYEERNLGVTTHFNGESSFKPENPYEDMTWDEYVEAKSREHEKEKKFSEPRSDGKNRGITFHSNGESREKTPEDIERDEHMFDDDYWVNKMNLSKEDLAEMVNKSVRLIAEKISLNEISMGLLDRAREAAHKDMMRNFGDSKIRNKRGRQWRRFTDEYGRLDREERDSICPHVDEADLANMPEDTYVVLNGDGRDAVSADFRTSYSGRAGTKEQCEEYVKRFYDMGANWEHLPEIMPLKDYLKSKHRR